MLTAYFSFLCLQNKLLSFQTVFFYLDVILAGLLQFLEPVLSLTGVDGRRRGHALALLAVCPLGDRLDSVKILGWGGWVVVLDTAAV